MNRRKYKIKYIPQIFRIIFFLLLYGIFGVFSFLFFRSYIAILILVTLIIIPLFSIFSLIYSIPLISYNLFLSDMEEDRIVNCGIRFDNNSYFSFLRVILTVRVDNSYYGLSNSFKYTISLHSKENFQNIIFNVSRCGKLHISIENVEFYDLCGLLKLRICDSTEAQIDIMPMPLEADEVVNSGLLYGLSDNEDDTRKGNEYSDTSNIREYIPGDRIKDIHWKLSAKRDILLVRERIKSCENRMIILLECINKPRINDDILSVFYTISMYCIKEGILVLVMYFDAASAGYNEYTISSVADLKDCISRIYAVRISPNHANQLGINGNYIKVGYINGNADYEIIEG